MKDLKIRIEGRVLVKFIVVSREQITGERKLKKANLHSKGKLYYFIKVIIY